MKRVFCFILLLFTICCQKEHVDEGSLLFSSLAVIGDSITYGKGSSNNISWSDIICDSFHVSDYVNYSVCGAVATSRNPESQYALCSQIEKMDTRFKVIMVMIGTNDCLMGKEITDIDEAFILPIQDLNYKQSFTHGFIYDLKSLITKSPNAFVIVVGPPSFSASRSIYLSDYIFVEQRVTELLGLPFIDLSYSPYTASRGQICSDGIHPTDLGYRILANYIIDELNNHILSRYN